MLPKLLCIRDVLQSQNISLGFKNVFLTFYVWTNFLYVFRTKATDESRLLNMLPERLRAEVAVHVHLDSLKKVSFINIIRHAMKHKFYLTLDEIGNDRLDDSPSL